MHNLARTRWTLWVILPLLLFLFLGTVARPKSSGENMVIILAVNGEVEVTTPGGLTYIPQAGGSIETGSTIRTGLEGSLELAWGEQGWARIDELSILTITDSGWREKEKTLWSRLRLEVGQVWVDILRKAGDVVDFSVETPTITAGVRGTAFSVRQFATGEAEVSVSRGLVEAASSQAILQVRSGEYVLFDAMGASNGVQEWNQEHQRKWNRYQKSTQSVGPKLEGAPLNGQGNADSELGSNPQSASVTSKGSPQS